MLKLITFILIFGQLACNQTQTRTDTKVLDFGLFTIETPKSWTQIKKQGIDSYGGRIAIDGKDTLDFDLGLYSNDLYEYDPIIIDSSMINDLDTSRTNINEIIFVKNRRRVDRDKYRKNNILWDTIDGHKAKIVFPRQTGIGTTGVYIDSLWDSKLGVVNFNLYGINLRDANEKRVLEILRTLKFNRK